MTKLSTVIVLIPLICIIYAAFSYGRVLYFAHYSKNPKIIQSDITLGTGTELKYIAAGDSTAVGEGASKVENTYARKIASKLSENNTVNYKNIAARGGQTTDVLENQLQKIIDFKPDVVTISMGANDATHLVSEKTILNNYQEIITKLLQNTEARIYITNIANFEDAKLLPLPFIKLIEYRSKIINPKILALENDRVKIINIHDFGWDKYPDKKVTYSLDHFHPSDIGYENWTNAFLDKIMN